MTTDATHATHATDVLLRRSLRHILRSPDTILTTVAKPIAMLLLFVYVFGSARQIGGTGRYCTYIMHGIPRTTDASRLAYTPSPLLPHAQTGRTPV